MAFLLDTHVVLWHIAKDPSLSQKAKEIIDTKSDLFFSVASLWKLLSKLMLANFNLTAFLIIF